MLNTLKFQKIYLLLFSLVLLQLACVSTTNAQTAPWCGEFLPMITEAWIGSPHQRVHFVPKYCNKIMVDGEIETIPSGIAVISGGVSADVTNTCVDKECDRALKPHMLYRVYLYKDVTNGSLKINFSVSEHKEGPHGNEVNAEDPSQSFIGLVATEDTGRVCGGMNLCLLSWFYRGHTGLGNWIGNDYGKPSAEVCAPGLTAVTSASVKVLTFGINSTFRQGYTVPNIYASGIITNTVVDKLSHAAIGIEWGGTPVRFEAGGPGVVVWPRFSNANIRPGTSLSFSTDGKLPYPLVSGKHYYVTRIVDMDRFAISESLNTPPINFEIDQIGRHIVIVNNRQGGPLHAFMSHSPGDQGTLFAVAIGALGAEEGWVKGTLMLSAPNGGCARVPNGMIYTSPHHS